MGTSACPYGFDSSLWTPRIESEVGSLMNGEVPPALREVPLLSSAITQDLTRDDVRVLYHYATMTAELVMSGGSALAFGVSPLRE